MRKFAAIAIVAIAALYAPARAADQLYLPGSLIIPMDTTYQDNGMLSSYGLVYSLLRNGVEVDWAIQPGKAYGAVDFTASATDVQSSASIVSYGYRGGPFVIDASQSAQALPVVQAWQAAHSQVKVHQATASFTAAISKQLLNPPDIAVFADGNEDIAFGYLNAAGIPMSNGSAWPSAKDNTGLYTCPGTKCCPDCKNESRVAGATTSNHKDGALFGSNGVPNYCQFMSMHYGAPANVPEVVAEVRAFLTYPVHFFAECQAVNAFENDVNGLFLTSGGLKKSTAPATVDYHNSDDPFSQAVGGYANPGGSEPSFGLAAGSSYYDANVVMVNKSGAAFGVTDVWMNGYMDNNPLNGKVSYLGGHAYTLALPISANPKTQGVRYFLNSLFEAPCATAAGAPSPWTSITGAPTTANGNYAFTVCYGNTGPGIAFDSKLSLTLPAGASVASLPGNGTQNGSTIEWNLESLAPGASTCVNLAVSFGAEGSYSFGSSLSYGVGVRNMVSSTSTFTVRFGHINLLRYATAPGFTATALDSVRDLEVAAFSNGMSFPHASSDLSQGAPDLIFYQLSGYAGDTLRVSNVNGALSITF
jgi:hypothetical protein